MSTPNHAVVVALCLAVGAPALGYTRSDVSDLNALTSGLQVLDLSALGLTNGMTIPFDGPAYSGAITATVYGDSAIFTPDLTDVVVVYEFEGTGEPTPIEAMEFAVNGGNIDLNFAELDGGVMGRIDSLSDVVLMDDPILTFNPGPANDSLLFDWGTPGLGDVLVTEYYGWYTRTTGAIDLGLISVEVRNAGSTQTQTLGVIDDPSQPNLDVPAPGTLAVFGLAAGAMFKRRRD
ncbi:MAG: PEP-CTERM sorting domain-containing protein [Phycisphaerales bacterium JB038]